MIQFHAHIIATRESDDPQYIFSKAWLAKRGIIVI